PTESPSMVTSVPAGAAAGVMAVTVGGWITSNGVALVAVPAFVVSVTGPLAAAAGTVTITSLSLAESTPAAAGPNLTDTRPANVVPVSATVVPTKPVDGDTSTIAGSTLKTAALFAEPAPLLTNTVPVVAPAGTVTRSMLLDSTTRRSTGTPLKR